MKTFLKDPDSTLDYGIDWGPWLEPVSDTITASTWTAESGIEIVDDAEFTTTRTVVWLRGGTAGETYTVTNQVTTAGGRIVDRSIKIKVREK